MAYLYGASIQGIQGFIFESNELKEIIGASEIVKKFDELDFQKLDNIKITSTPKKLLQAAGNIRLEIDNKDDMEKIALYFPKYIMQMAYGITVSQAVVDIKKAKADGKDPKELLETLLKIQRNRVSLLLDKSINIIKLAKKNARAIQEGKSNSVSTEQKLESHANYKRLANGTIIDEISQLSNKKNKIAIIHADGNGLGDIVRHYTGDDMAEFSESLKNATEEAFNEAKKSIKNSKYREVILGGDDLTLICDADYALEFTKEYLSNFQAKTLEKLAEYKESISLQNYTGELTACAGIAYCNEKYPFHYAVALAEDLCKYAKNESGRESSCLMFHNIEGSHYESFDNFLKDELTVKKEPKIYFNFGPYYLEENDEKPTIGQLQHCIKIFVKETSPLSALRTWIAELHDNHTHAQTLLKRINKNLDPDWKDEIPKCGNSNFPIDTCIIGNKTPIYDILQIDAVTTKEGK